MILLFEAIHLSNDEMRQLKALFAQKGRLLFLFPSRRYPPKRDEWQIRPMVLQQGAGYALVLGKKA